MTTRLEQGVGSADGLLEVMELIRHRQLSQAEKRLRALARRRPNDAAVVGLQGALATEQGKPNAAMELLAKSLLLEGSPAVLRRNLSGLVATALAHGQRDLAKQALERPVPTHDADVRLAPADLNTVVTLANHLGMFGRYEKASDLLTSFWDQIRDDPRALEMLGGLRIATDQPKQALEALKRARDLTMPTPRLLIALGAAAAAAGDSETAQSVVKEYVQRFPAYLSDQLPGQLMIIGVANWHQKLIKRLSSVQRIHFGGNFISQVAGRHFETYRILSLLLNSENAIKAISSNPTPDVIYNSVVNPEVILRHGFVDRLATLISVWDRPVLNHPAFVLKTTRQASVGLYAHIQSVVVPKIGEFSSSLDNSELIEQIEAEFDYPLIARGMVEQEGKNAFRVLDRSELEAALQQLKSTPRFYVIVFHESRHEEGLYRKIRAAVAGDTIQIVRVDHDRAWNVHGRKADVKIDFYRKRPHLLEQESAICMDPDTHLGPQVMRTLRAMRACNPLDVFGIDFDVMPDGRLLFFEANAAMNLLSSADPRIDYPKEPEARFMEAFVDFTKRLVESPRKLARTPGAPSV